MYKSARTNSLNSKKFKLKSIKILTTIIINNKIYNHSTIYNTKYKKKSSIWIKLSLIVSRGDFFYSFRSTINRK